MLLAAIAIAWGASLAGPFHLDDASLFTGTLWRPLQIRGLTYLTFWIDQALGGQNALGYHAVNLVLHASAVLLLLDTLRRVISVRAAVVAAAIFAVHPLAAEPVNYIFARGTLLATLLCIASFHAWVRGRIWLAVVWFGVALLAKEECVSFPLFLLLFEGGRKMIPISAMMVLSVIAGLRVLAASVNTGSGVGTQAGISPLNYLQVQGWVILRYLRLLVVPWGFSADPEIGPVPLWLALGAWIVIALLALLAWRQPAGLWFTGGLILLLPSSSILPAADLAADRRMYLPMIAFSTAAALLIGALPTPVLTALAGVLMILSLQRTLIWNSNRALWSEAVAHAPHKLRPRIQLARSLPPPEALQAIEAAKIIAPDNPELASEEGRLYLEMQDPQNALAAFGQALAAAPSNPDYVNNRGAALLALGQTDAARQDFERALKLDPRNTEAKANLKRLGH